MRNSSLGGLAGCMRFGWYLGGCVQLGFFQSWPGALRQVSSRLRTGLLGLLDGSSPGPCSRDNSTFLGYASSGGEVGQRLLLLTLDFFLNFESSSSWRRWAGFILDLCYILGGFVLLCSLSNRYLCIPLHGILVGGLGISMCFHELMKESWNVHVPAVDRSYVLPSCKGSRPSKIFCAATRLHISIGNQSRGFGNGISLCYCWCIRVDASPWASSPQASHEEQRLPYKPWGSRSSRQTGSS